jgi:hypothetical protein
MSEAFEKWWYTYRGGGTAIRSGNEFVELRDGSIGRQIATDSWAESRRVALEEAAKMTERRAEGSPVEYVAASWRSHAERIRALATEGK